MAATQKKRRKLGSKFEWKPGWNYVRERVMEPSFCAPRQYRTATFSKAKNVKGIVCCPRGTKMAPRRRGCIRAGKVVSKPRLQALRHGVEKFKWNHPRIWARLQKARPRKGIRTVRTAVSADGRRAKKRVA